MTALNLHDDESERLASILEAEIGIRITPDKYYLLDGRLARLMIRHKVSSFTQLCEELLSRRNRRLVEEVVHAITTHETSFFRDWPIFQVLRERILSKYKAGGRSLRIWSAGCSTGQEIWSIAMHIRETMPGLAHRVAMKGTDVSPMVIAQARSGFVTDLEARRGLNDAMLARYFEKVPGGFRARDELRAMADFEEANLLEGMHQGGFDVVFCRNVLFYFGDENRRRAMSNIAASLVADGFLILGSSETIPRSAVQFEPEAMGAIRYYRRKNRVGIAAGGLRS